MQKKFTTVVSPKVIISSLFAISVWLIATPTTKALTLEEVDGKVINLDKVVNGDGAENKGIVGEIKDINAATTSANKKIDGINTTINGDGAENKGIVGEIKDINAATASTNKKIDGINTTINGDGAENKGIVGEIKDINAATASTNKKIDDINTTINGDGAKNIGVVNQVKLIDDDLKKANQQLVTFNTLVNGSDEKEGLNAKVKNTETQVNALQKSTTENTEAIKIINHDLKEKGGHVDTKFNEANKYTDKQVDTLKKEMNGRINGLTDKVNRNDRKASAGIASAMAMASIPYANDSQSFGVAVGNFREKQALAVGLQTLINSKTRLRINLSADTENNIGAAAGISISW